MSLTDKQQRFVEEYLCDLNATQAAIRAGYSEKTAHSIGHENLSKPEIAAALAEAMQERSKRTEVTAEWVIEHLRENVIRAMQEEQVTKAGMPTGEWTYEGSVANRALELLGKHLGLFSDNLNLRTPDGPLDLQVTRRVVHVANRLAEHIGTNGNGSGQP